VARFSSVNNKKTCTNLKKILLFPVMKHKLLILKGI